MVVNQINFTYIPAEDRLLLRINTHDRAEIRFWLTRSIVIQLLSSLSHAEGQMVEPVRWNTRNSSQRQIMQQFEQAALAAEPDFKSQFVPEAASYPLGDMPVLVTKIGIRTEFDHTVSVFELATNQTLTINFDSQLAAGFYKLLCDIVMATDWNLPRPLISMTAISFFNVAESQTVH